METRQRRFVTFSQLSLYRVDRLEKHSQCLLLLLLFQIYILKEKEVLQFIRDSHDLAIQYLMDRHKTRDHRAGYLSIETQRAIPSAEITLSIFITTHITLAIISNSVHFA